MVEERPGTEDGRVTPGEAYAYCNIPPNEFWNYTPAELEFMVTIRGGRKNRLKREMTDKEMESQIMRALHPYFGSMNHA